MGLVLAFDAAPRKAMRQPLARRSPAETAAILFFTGVRYERDRQSSAQTSARAQSSGSTPAS